MNDIPSPAGKIVDALINSIKEDLPGLVEGVYLTGSIPLHDFYLNKSDIDFIVLCESLPVKEAISKLQSIHNRIQKRFNQPKLSGFYITKECLHLHIGPPVKITGVHEGKVKEMLWGKGLTAVTLKELKTTACTVYGIPAQTLPIEVSDKELDHTLFENLNSYWQTWMRRYTILPHRYLLLVLFPWFTEWPVLGVARQLYTLQTGKITSKLKAGEFALHYLPSKHHHVVQQAIKIRASSSQFHFAPSRKRARQTIACVNSLMAIFTDFYFQKYSVRNQ